MKRCKRSSDVAWDCNHRQGWTATYRYRVLVGDVRMRAREFLRESARSLEMTIYAAAIIRDRVHLAQAAGLPG